MDDVEYRSLLRHMEWADALMWTSALALPEAQGDTRLIGLLHHLHSVQWAYLQVWRQEPIHVPEREAFATLPTVRDWARPYYAELHAFAATLSAARLADTLAVPWAAEVLKRYGTAEPASLGEMVLQVVMHSTYHRAQVATRVKELGGAPALTDFIVWVWTKRPEPGW